MGGEKVETADLTEAGFIGDRAYALIETETGKVMSGKTPRVGPKLLGCLAAFVQSPVRGDAPPACVHHASGGHFGAQQRSGRSRHPRDVVALM
jgi:hypothetical protein